MGLCVISLFLLHCFLAGCDIVSTIVRGLPQIPGMLKRCDTYLPCDSKGFCLFLWLLLLQPSVGSLDIQADGKAENHTTLLRLYEFFAYGYFSSKHQATMNYNLQELLSFFKVSLLNLSWVTAL